MNKTNYKKKYNSPNFAIKFPESTSKGKLQYKSSCSGIYQLSLIDVIL